MDVSTILKPTSIRCEAQVRSKKHALDILSDMLADAGGGLSAGEILEGLVNRERLGSTALGNCIAMPHTRQPGIAGPVAAVLKLAEPIDFDAPDGKPVDLLFGVLVPEEGDPAELREILETVKELPRTELHDAAEPRSVYNLCIDKPPASRPGVNE
jgi:PTS system nitrogen regulatory IIA component